MQPIGHLHTLETCVFHMKEARQLHWLWLCMWITLLFDLTGSHISVHADLAKRVKRRRHVPGQFLGYYDRGNTATPGSYVNITCEFGQITIQLLPEYAPRTCSMVAELANKHSCPTCHFYRHEPVPPNWGVASFWGPPYALLQGSLLQGFAEAPPFENAAQIPVKKGYACIIPGSKEFFIATADHPEWGHSHTIFGRVEDVDASAEHLIPYEPFHTLTSGEITTRWLNNTYAFYLQPA